MLEILDKEAKNLCKIKLQIELYETQMEIWIRI